MNSIIEKKYKIGLTFIKYIPYIVILFIVMAQFTFVTAGVPCTYISPDDPSQNIPLNCDPTLKPDATGINSNKPNTTGISKTSSDGVNIDTGIKNPIAGVDDIPSFIEAILNFVLIIGIPIVTLAIIYSGFLFVTAQGNTEKLGKAKKALLYTLIGAALLLGSYVIANAIKGTVDEIKSTT